MKLTMFKSALLVEDDRNLALAISLALKKMGIATHTTSTLTEAKNFLLSPENYPELILLDRHLPDGDGIQVCIELRERLYSGFIIILSAAGEVSERVKGLKRGADDYLAKPFAWEELQARLVALSRRRSSHDSFKDDSLWQTDKKRLRVFGPLGWVELTPLEFKLVEYLIVSQGEIVSREQLLKHVWGFSLLTKTRSVDLFMSKIRKLFENNPEIPKHFLTVRGAGYRFSASASKD